MPFVFVVVLCIVVACCDSLRAVYVLLRCRCALWCLFACLVLMRCYVLCARPARCCAMLRIDVCWCDAVFVEL